MHTMSDSPCTEGLECATTMESDAVRCRFESLAQSDSVDKPTALEVMALHHDMQTQYLRHCHSMERRIDALTHEITTMQRTHRYCEMFEVLTRDVALLQKQVKELYEKQAEATGRRR